MSRRTCWRFFRLLAIWLLLPLSNAHAGNLTLAVAANFTDTTASLVETFEASTGHQVTASFGSTGKLYAQIRNGAPFDVFMAADAQRPQLLESEGMAVPGSRFTYARGKLVLWSPETAAFISPIAYLNEQPFSRLAIANPKTAPYGLAAQQVLEHLELWSPLQPKLVRGDSIAQTFQFIASGNAQAGLVALAQVKAWPDQDGTLWRIPQSYYAPINQQAILLKRGADNTAARDWLAFLQSPDAVAIIQGYGYDTAD
ncbi:molybdate ABC transporter substrate-binding protein [Marinobacter nauticus]|uniref:molybdate ABC transporter substrate-binding protein n=1 Tax=Marinobacter nauticus TaxID=2743 RepID=UPI000EB10F84|nr:molybdate ABC transporter substrate-binding protein [Marinobacter nauticus]MBW3198309.1 molybdate ABC transporter substrate-binding protein [Marinobacter nauticus]MBY6183719.1 molybdate ABC transporter substrate-binding protein [Marinobacter nauticus]RKR78422.1 molybdate transport system substrate-binding protein [Marinobacter nauticus]